jgi:catechol 2,3-dioxygenase-like lactoylglutathione lyase family enzyme
MSQEILGIHHITAIAGDPQRNLDFYAGLLGMRFVKRTVNFDAPDVYHFYYGDEIGTPGTLLTFFPFPDAAPGKRGSGEVSSVAFRLPAGTEEFWLRRLSGSGIQVRGPFKRFDEEIFSFEDPDGLQLEFVFVDSEPKTTVWKESPVPSEFAIRRIHGVTIGLASLSQTTALVGDTMGFQLSAERDSLSRYLIGQGARQAAVDFAFDPSLPPARISAGSVHHVAWRVPDDSVQRFWQSAIDKIGLNVTEIVDRRYFRSIYFREPGGVLFEIATDPPGMTVDEDRDQLGARLMLPPWLEMHRKRIERVLPPISVPAASGVPVP